MNSAPIDGLIFDAIAYIASKCDTIGQLALAQTCIPLHKLMPKVHRHDMIRLNVAEFAHLYAWLDSCEVVNPVEILAHSPYNNEWCGLAPLNLGMVDYDNVNIPRITIYKLSEIYCIARYHDMVYRMWHTKYVPEYLYDVENYLKYSLYEMNGHYYNYHVYLSQPDPLVFQFASKYYFGKQYKKYLDIFSPDTTIDQFDAATHEYLTSIPAALTCYNYDNNHQHTVKCIFLDDAMEQLYEKLHEHNVVNGRNKAIFWRLGAPMVSKGASILVDVIGDKIAGWFS